MQVRELELNGVLEITPKKFGDDRGFFSETYNADVFAKHGIDDSFVQDNQSLSKQVGVVRGLHYQVPPFAQAKLLRVVRGRVFDVAVDIRAGSPTFGHWVGLEISADKWNQILIPTGFAHGFVTLEPNCEVIYKVSAPYDSASDRAIRHDDPDINIDWPIPVDARILSDKDRDAPALSDVSPEFNYEE